MKILVLQLARFGDIYLSWPTLRALKRNYPEAEIHFMVRERFRAAAHGIEAVDRLRVLPMSSIFRPLLEGDDGIEGSLFVLSNFVDTLVDEQYDRVINLSYSPFSSYLTHHLACLRNIEVQGYTRHKDGTLAIPDDLSAYFYAQVGIGRFNRFHLGEIFSSVAGVELESSDWAPLSGVDLETEKNRLLTEFGIPDGPYYTVHISASQSSKSYPAFKWRQVLAKLEKEVPEHFILLGSKDELDLAEEIMSASRLGRIHSLVGKTQMDDLFPLIHGAEGLLGADSVAMHIASLSATRAFNLSFASVNFWETGPRVDGSRVVWAEAPESLPSDRVVDEFLSFRAEEPAPARAIIRSNDHPQGFQLYGYIDEQFEWSLIHALYMDGQFPPIPDELTESGLQRLNEVVQLALEQIRVMGDGADNPAASLEILQQVDDIIKTIHKLAPRLHPMIAWFQTERARMAPGNFANTLERTKSLFQQLQLILTVYFGPVNENAIQIGGSDGEQAMVK